MPEFWSYSRWHAWAWLQKARHRPRRCRSHRVRICRRRAAKYQERWKGFDWRGPVRVAHIDVSKLVPDGGKLDVFTRLLEYQSRVE